MFNSKGTRGFALKSTYWVGFHTEPMRTSLPRDRSGLVGTPKREGLASVATEAKGQRRGLATALAVMLLVVAAGVIATSGDSWAVKMILGLLAIDIAVRLYRWGLT